MLEYWKSIKWAWPRGTLHPAWVQLPALRRIVPARPTRQLALPLQRAQHAQILIPDRCASFLPAAAIVAAVPLECMPCHLLAQSYPLQQSTEVKIFSFPISARSMALPLWAPPRRAIVHRSELPGATPKLLRAVSTRRAPRPPQTVGLEATEAKWRAAPLSECLLVDGGPRWFADPTGASSSSARVPCHWPTYPPPPASSPMVATCVHLRLTVRRRGASSTVSFPASGAQNGFRTSLESPWLLRRPRVTGSPEKCQRRRHRAVESPPSPVPNLGCEPDAQVGCPYVAQQAQCFYFFQEFQCEPNSSSNSPNSIDCCLNFEVDQDCSVSPFQMFTVG
jgi:hypothetical protein